MEDLSLIHILLRTGAKFGLVELTFSGIGGALLEQLESMDVYPEDGRIVLSRKLLTGRSTSKINGETVSMGLLKDVASLLIDIHGQHEHQSLLHKKNHLAFLDLYAGDAVKKWKEQTETAYREYQRLSKKLEESRLDEQEQKRELSLAPVSYTHLDVYKRQFIRSRSTVCLR